MAAANKRSKTEHSSDSGRPPFRERPSARHPTSIDAHRPALAVKPVSSLVSATWLSSQLERGVVKVIDASWYLPSMGRNPKEEFASCHIPGAQFFDIDATDDTSSLPHMVPSATYFAETMEKLGVGSDDHVVCYDGKGIFSSARLWWMLRAFGHPMSSVLDGGLPEWRRLELPVESGAAAAVAPPTTPFSAALRPKAVCTFDQILEGIRCGRRLGRVCSDVVILFIPSPRLSAENVNPAGLRCLCCAAALLLRRIGVGG